VTGTGESEIFEQHRSQLIGIAYRITGSWTDAEDVVQDVWLRWEDAHLDVARPHSWLVTQHVDQAGPRFPADDRQASESTERFLQACLDRNVEELLRVLSPTVVMLSDGGGEVRAARRALVGAQEVLTFLAGLDRKGVFGDATFTLGQVNMHPGIITSTGGRVLSAMTFDYDKSGRIAVSYVVLAPSKLTHVSTAADRA
jgi:RNA polymerase sigma-70 factor (ECF subfamily)